MAYLGAHKIVLGSGDYHWDGVYAPKALAQLTDNDYGKVLEIDLENRTALKVSIGNRNMQGVIVDDRKRIWVVEHGPMGGDELNLIKQGANYGWPAATYGIRYNGLPWPGAKQIGRHDNYELPVYAWMPSIATSGLAQVRGFHPTWDGDFLVATLRAQSLYRLRIRQERVIFAEPIYIGERIRYVHQHDDGQIVLWTDSRKLIFMSPAPVDHRVGQIINRLIDSFPYEERAAKRIKETAITCMECHSFEAEGALAGPALGRVFGRDIASSSFSGYSNALRARKGTWTEANLKAFLRNPNGFAPGTTMRNTKIEDDVILDGLVKVLDSLKSAAEFGGK